MDKIKKLTTYFAYLMFYFSCGAVNDSNDYSLNDFDIENISTNANGQIACNANECLTDSNRLLHFKIEPPPSSQLLPQILTSIAINKLNEGITLSRSFNLSGRITGISPSIKLQSASSNANMIFIPINFNSLDFMTSWIINSNIKQTNYNKNGLYAINLIDKQDYLLKIISNNPENIPPTFITFLNRNNYNAFVQENFNINQNYKTLTGKINISFSQKQENILTQLNVKLLDNQLLVSNIAALNDNGEFTLYLSDYNDINNNDITLEIAPIKNNSFLPTFNKEIKIKSINKNISLGTFDLGLFEPVINVNIKVIDKNNNPIENTVVYLISEFKDAVNIIETVTSSQGLASAKIIAGKHTCAVITNAQSPYSDKVRTYFINNNNQEIKLTLENRKEIFGTLLDFNNQPVEGAVLNFFKYSLPKLAKRVDSTKLFKANLSATTDPNGKWCIKDNKNECQKVLVDAAKYKVLISPPWGKELSNHSLVFNFEKDDKPTAILPKPIKIASYIKRFDGQAVDNAYVGIFSSEKYDDYESMLLGFAYTNKQGYFEAYIAPQ